MSIIFSKNIVLENARVMMRPLEISDFDFLKKYSNEQPGLWKYSLICAAGEQNLELYINKAIEGRKQEKEYPFIVYDKIVGAYAGSTRFYDIQPLNKTLQLGYTWYGGEFHGTGLNVNCKFLLLQQAFENWKIERVEFRADYENKRSIAAMKKIGCVEEGVLRSHLPKPGGGRRGSIILSILKSEWESEIKNRLFEMIG